MLQETFTHLLQQYTNDTAIIEQYWNEIAYAYSGKGRHYHTLTHLENLLNELNSCRSQITNYNTLLFSVYYHDIVYNVLKHDNEEQSTSLAEKRLHALIVPGDMIAQCTAQILATKKHELSPDNDTNLFTDADLCILGQGWDAYQQYSIQIRKEYSIYPSLVYNPGRKKVLQHFLDMDRIFKTAHFYNRFEAQARKNLNRERDSL